MSIDFSMGCFWSCKGLVFSTFMPLSKHLFDLSFPKFVEIILLLNSDLFLVTIMPLLIKTFERYLGHLLHYSRVLLQSRSIRYLSNLWLNNEFNKRLSCPCMRGDRRAREYVLALVPTNEWLGSKAVRLRENHPPPGLLRFSRVSARMSETMTQWVE